MRLHEDSAQGCTTVDWMAFAAPLPAALVVPLQVAGIVLIATAGRVHYYRICLCSRSFVPVAFGPGTIGDFCPKSNG